MIDNEWSEGYTVEMFIESYAFPAIFLIGLCMIIWMMWPRLKLGIPRYTKYRDNFIIGLVMLIMGVLFTISDILVSAGWSLMSVIFLVAGFINVTTGIANRDKWKKKNITDE